MIGYKYQINIRHIDGTIITSIVDNNKGRFLKEICKAQDDLVAYVGECNENYTNEELYLDVTLAHLKLEKCLVGLRK